MLNRNTESIVKKSEERTQKTYSEKRSLNKIITLKSPGTFQTSSLIKEKSILSALVCSSSNFRYAQRFYKNKTYYISSEIHLHILKESEVSPYKKIIQAIMEDTIRHNIAQI